MDQMGATALELGIVGLALVVMWRLLELVKVWWLCKDGKTSNGAAYMSRIQCMTDPVHFERIKKIEKYSERSYIHATENAETMKAIRANVASGAFGCSWTQEKVFKMMAAIEDNTKAINYLTQELRKQNGK